MSAPEEGAPDARARTCPARSPETDSPCALPDTWRAHEAAQGCHESALVNSSRAVWPARDYRRWLDEPEAMAKHILILGAAHDEHRRPRRGCPGCIDAKRVEAAVKLLRVLRPDGPEYEQGAILALLAADDLQRQRGPFATGGLLTGPTAGGPILFGAAPPQMPPGLADEIRRVTQRRRMERGQ